MRKFFIYIISSLIIIVFVFFLLIAYDENQVVNTGFTPEYERQEELDVLVNKAQSIGLNEKESARLDWLLEDRKKEVLKFIENNNHNHE